MRQPTFESMNEIKKKAFMVCLAAHGGAFSKDLPMKEISTNHGTNGTAPWRAAHRTVTLHVGLAQTFANLAGAGVCFSYFALFESTGPATLITSGLVTTVIMFAGLVVIGYVLNRKWEQSLSEYILKKMRGQSVSSPLEAEARRKILNLPFMATSVALINWGMASLVMSGHNLVEMLPRAATAVAVSSTLRVFVGVLISGIITSAIVFFVVEIQCRRIWPLFFPQGGLTGIPGALKLSLRSRMFVAFLLASFVPMTLLAVLSYNKARLMLIMNPEDVIQSLFNLTLFLLLAALAVAVLLSFLVSTSIINPVKKMERAMVKVQKGDLSASARVSANDELGILAQSFDQMIEGLRDRERIKETFGRFVTPEIAQAILENPPVLGGENTEVSVLFSDVRNYTAICEQLSPGRVIALLNDYFAHMVEAVEKHNGLVYQFVGDGIMAVFGAPVKLADHPTHCVLSALDMLDALDRFNAEGGEGAPHLRIGIGINTGPVVAGIIGTEQRMEYRVVGDSVNLAARIEALNKDLRTDVLISGATAAQLRQGFPLKRFPPIRVKGKEEPIEVYEVARKKR